MIPKLCPQAPLLETYNTFLNTLEESNFGGDIQRDYGNRITQSTDNSIYQITPQAVVYPKSTDDLMLLTLHASQPEFLGVQMSPRGGGTGTNGQSLSHGILVDLSKYMNTILEINCEEGWVRVETGVVKDQLNAALKPHGYFFAPDLSTSNRATIGGMINTDASGQGSCLYGKTRDHVLELKTVLLNGSVLNSKPLDDEEYMAVSERQDRIGLIHRLINSIDIEYGELIEEIFPSLNRCLTGYDLAHIRDKEERFNVNNILCGSEGTLGFISEAKLNIIPLPKHSALVVVKYGHFDSSLRDATELMKSSPAAIETIDSKVLNLAMNDFIWHQVEEFFADKTPTPVQGINLVEFIAQNERELEEKVEKFTKEIHSTIEKDKNGRIGYAIAHGKENINKIWAMRKRAVGLLGNAQGEARPIPFVEDTAVPPEKLADFILEFREILDSYELEYGMFGHVDAGVLHVRPSLDMKDTHQEAIAWEISDKVADLTHKYGGLLWGEHGKGVRSQYSPQFFGELYPQLRRIKAAFDPHNQLNPGKIATPGESEKLLKINEVPTRGQSDRVISSDSWQAFNDAVYCNGNGTCFNWNPNDAMCPSWKATRKRTHSPKGRASLIREWLKLSSEKNYSPANALKDKKSSVQIFDFLKKVKHTLLEGKLEDDFSHEVYDSMAGCLACKSCTGQCPIKIDVPEFRAKFLAIYHTRYLRPVKDYLVGLLEYTLPPFSKVPKLYNFFMGNKVVKFILKKRVGFVDAPLLSEKPLTDYNINIADAYKLQSLSEEEKQLTVVIVQDAFTSYFEAPLVADCIQFLQKLGFNVYLAPYKPNGKPLHVHGFLNQFEKVSSLNTEMLNSIARTGVSLVGIDPSMTYTYRSEYPLYANNALTLNAPTLNAPTLKVKLIQEFLVEHLAVCKEFSENLKKGVYKLMPHCIETANAASTLNDWKKIFTTLGQELEIENLGCCGMSGTYGHEARNLEASKKLYSMSWRPIVEKYNPNHQHTTSDSEPNPENQHNTIRLVATGYSCRSQIKREDAAQIPHPLQALLKQMIL